MTYPDIETLKGAVVQLIQSNGHVSYAELQRSFPEMFGGRGSHSCPDRPWIVHWQGLSDLGCDVIEQLLQQKLIFTWPTPRYTYFIEGVLVDLPFSYDVIGTKTESWLPIVFHTSACPGDVFDQVAQSWIDTRSSIYARGH